MALAKGKSLGLDIKLWGSCESAKSLSPFYEKVCVNSADLLLIIVPAILIMER